MIPDQTHHVHRMQIVPEYGESEYRVRGGAWRHFRFDARVRGVFPPYSVVDGCTVDLARAFRTTLRKHAQLDIYIFK